MVRMTGCEQLWHLFKVNDKNCQVQKNISKIGAQNHQIGITIRAELRAARLIMRAKSHYDICTKTLSK